MKIAKEAVPYLAVLSAAAIVMFFISKIIFALVALLFVFVMFFFRNPSRNISHDSHAILSPADGRVQEISTIVENEFIKGEAVKISIFLSIFDVHMNRIPVKGKITYENYRPGKYLPAFKEHASELNEKKSLGIENEKISVIVNQITGFIARRIICYRKKGDLVNQGEIYGIIKFGSCTEILIPAQKVSLNVKVGDKVRGGVSILGGVINYDKTKHR